MGIKKLSALLAAAMMVFSLTACSGKGESSSDSSSSGPPEPTEFPVTVRDVLVDEKPHSIVSLSPALTEMVVDLGYQDQLAGISDYCDDIDRPKCGTAVLPNFDQLKAVDVDFVISEVPLSQKDAIEVQQLGADVIVLPPVTRLEELRAIYVDLGTLFGGELTGKPEAEAVMDQKYERLADLKQNIASVQGDEPVTVAYLRMLDYTIATGDTFESDALAYLGLENEAKKYGSWVYPSADFKDFDPGYILYDPDDVAMEDLKANKLYAGLAAVKGDNLIAVDMIAFERQSYKMFSELEKIVLAIFPDAGSRSSQADDDTSSDVSSEEEDDSSGADK